MIYVISKATFGSYNVRDIQCNANWCSCPYSDYALIPDDLVDGILATKGYCDITLNGAGTEVTAFTARTIPAVPEECHAEDQAATIPKTASGSHIYVKDSGDAPLMGLKLYGKTTQNGTPAPQSPVPLETVGDSGSVDVTVAGKNLIRYPYSSETTTTKGITFTDNGDGSISVSGTAMGITRFYLSSLSVNTISGVGRCTISTGSNDGSLRWEVLDGATNPRIGLNTVYDFKGAPFGLALYVPAGAKVDTTIYPMLNIGETALPYEPYKGKTLTIQTPNGLPGIPVSSGGNFTDENGQQWICDEVDFARGVYVQRVAKKVVTTCDGKNLHTNGQAYAVLNSTGFAINIAPLCTRYLGSAWSNENGYAYVLDGVIIINDSRFTDTSTARTILAEEKPEFILQLATPVETPLSAEEMAQYAALHTHKPNTTIFNNGGANMDVRYCTPNTAVPMNFGRTDSVLTTDEHGCVVATPKFETFAPAGYVSDRLYYDTYDQWLAGLKSVYNGMTNNTRKIITIGLVAAGAVPSGSWVAELTRFYAEYGFIKITNDTYPTGLVLSINGSWPGVLEWVNPPMIPGVKYRTTERCDGKPVYATSLNLGVMGTGENKVQNTSLYGTPIRATGRANTAVLPFIVDENLAATYSTYLSVDGGEIRVNLNRDGVTVKVQIWYIEE